MRQGHTSQNRRQGRMRRHTRVRKRVQGTSNRPRLCVFRSNRYIYAQVIDDDAGSTMAAASSQEQDLRSQSLNRQTAAQVGTLIAERARSAGVQQVVFDRGGYSYHGRVKALADAAREAGLDF